MSNKKVRLVLIAVAVVLCLGIAYVLFMQKNNASDSQTAGLTKVPRYNHPEGEVRCLALSPECGECYGQVINKECYVDTAKLTPEQLRTMGL